MLIDEDTKPSETILYLSAELLSIFKTSPKIKPSQMMEIYDEKFKQQPLFKFILALDFLFLAGKITTRKGGIIYVSQAPNNL